MIGKLRLQNFKATGPIEFSAVYTDAQLAFFLFFFFHIALNTSLENWVAPLQTGFFFPLNESNKVILQGHS